MHLIEVVARDNELGPYVWIDPWKISGIDAYRIKHVNRKQWFEGGGGNLDTADLCIVEYLLNCLRKARECRQCGDAVPLDLDVSSERQLNAVIYMIDSWGSNFAAVMFSATDLSQLVTDQTAAEALDLLEIKYLQAEPFVRDIFRDFILELYQYGPQWDPSSGRFEESLQVGQRGFLERILKTGYVTLNKESGHPIPGQSGSEQQEYL